MTPGYYVTQFNRLYKGPAWFGESYLEKFNNITEHQAFIKPVKDVHSIAQLISHCIYWRRALIHVLEGNPYEHSVTAPENWVRNDRLQDTGWLQLQEDLRTTQNIIISKIKDLQNEDLDYEFREGSSVADLITGVIQHDIYHLGQLGLVQKMI